MLNNADGCSSLSICVWSFISLRQRSDNRCGTRMEKAPETELQLCLAPISSRESIGHECAPLRGTLLRVICGVHYENFVGTRKDCCTQHHMRQSVCSIASPLVLLSHYCNIL